ncbi:MAG: arylsulfatase A-like enzyme [Pseudohongiellaceae bacterium]
MKRSTATVLLWVLALTLPLGAVLQPWLAPSRSHMPAVPRGLHTPVLLITVPGLRADRVHHLGYDRETTPNLDRLLRHGVSFTRAYSASNDGGATLAALHASRHPQLNGVLSSDDVLPEERPTLADKLAPYDYDSLAVLGDPSVVHMGLEQGFQQVTALPTGASSDQAFAAALQFVDETQSPSWFVWVDLPDLLPPYGGDFADEQRFAPDMPASFAEEEPFGFISETEQRRRGWGAQERRWLNDRYDGALHHMDASIGRFLEALDERMALQTMVVCVTGTRGEEISERPGVLAAHGLDLYETSIHVPLIFRLPAQHVRNRLLDEFARTEDVGPTLLQLSLKHGARSQWLGSCGKSLFDIMVGRREPVSRTYSQGRHSKRSSKLTAAQAMPPLSQAVRADRFKLIQTLGTGKGVEMYNLSKDPNERSNRSTTQAAVTDALAKFGEDWAAGCGEEP